MDGKQPQPPNITVEREMTHLFTVELVTWGYMANGTVETQTVTFCNILSFTVKCGSCSKVFETLKSLQAHVESKHSENRGGDRAGIHDLSSHTSDLVDTNSPDNPVIVKMEPTSDSEDTDIGDDVNVVDKVAEHGDEQEWNASESLKIDNWSTDKDGLCLSSHVTLVKYEMPSESANPVMPVTIIHKNDAAKLKSKTTSTREEKIMMSTGTDMTQSPKKLRKNASAKQYPCSDCEMILQSAYKLRIHLRSHTGEKPFLCTHLDEETGKPCGRAFSLKYNLQQHQWIHGTIQRENLFKCSVCDKTFWRLHRLKTHSRKHTGERPFSCDVCGERFGLNSTLTCHKRVHTGEKPFVCKVCDNRFTVLSSLRVHMRIHTGERPFSCDKCDQAFKSNSELRKHSVLHTGEKPHVCQVCGKGFAMRVNYNSHIKIHMGHHYVCDICGKSFKTAQSLNRCKRLHEETSAGPAGVTMSTYHIPQTPQDIESSHLLLDNLASVTDTSWQSAL